jgi:hypothetical protein
VKFTLILCTVGGLVCLLMESVSAASGPVTFTAAQVRTHFDMVEKLDPTQTHLYDQLVKRFGRKAIYSADEVTAIISPKVPGSKADIVKLPITPRHLPVPYDAFSREQVQSHFAILRSTDLKSKATMEALDQKFGVQPWYLATELREVEKNGAVDVPPMVDRLPTPVVAKAEAEVKAGKMQSVFLDGFRRPLIRHDWTDVLLNEDESQPDNNSAKKVDDLVGATFSYARNFLGPTDTWNTVGALIFPWVWDGVVEPGLIPDHVGFAPSLSVNRVSTNGASTGEVDQLYYRMGTFIEWYEMVPGLTDLQLRGAGVYGTDTGNQARMPGFEVDLEPRFLFNNSLGSECVYKIGYRNTLIHKEPLKEDGSDQSLLDYQLRVWMHIEGGDIQNVGKAFAVVPESFFRVGPTMQLRANAPAFWKGASLTALYSYLPAQSGPEGHDSLLKLDGTLALVADTAKHEKISLNANYTRGGLNFTKQGVDTFTIGLSVLY